MATPRAIALRKDAAMQQLNEMIAALGGGEIAPTRIKSDARLMEVETLEAIADALPVAKPVEVEAKPKATKSKDKKGK